MENLVSLKFSAVFDDGTGRLFPAELPCMLVPACVKCLAMEGVCAKCATFYCHACSTCQNCCLKTPSENTPRAIIESCELGDSGSTKELVVNILPNLYEQLRETTDEYVALEDDSFIVKMPIPLGDCFIEDEVVGRYFGTSVIDFKRLCQNASPDYPNGMVVVNLDRERTLVCSYNTFYEPHIVELYDALEWLKKVAGTIGLIVKKGQNGKVNCEIFELLVEDEEDNELSDKSDYLLDLVRSWECD